MKKKKKKKRKNVSYINYKSKLRKTFKKRKWHKTRSHKIANTCPQTYSSAVNNYVWSSCIKLVLVQIKYFELDNFPPCLTLSNNYYYYFARFDLAQNNMLYYFFGSVKYTVLSLGWINNNKPNYCFSNKLYII